MEFVCVERVEERNCLAARGWSDHMDVLYTCDADGEVSSIFRCSSPVPIYGGQSKDMADARHTYKEYGRLKQQLDSVPLSRKGTWKQCPG